MDQETAALLLKAAQFTAMAQQNDAAKTAELAKRAEADKAFAARAEKSAAVLVSEGILSPLSATNFVDKLAESPLGVFDVIDKLARARDVDNLGTPEVVTKSAGTASKPCPFMKAFMPDRVG